MDTISPPRRPRPRQVDTPAGGSAVPALGALVLGQPPQWQWAPTPPLPLPLGLLAAASPSPQPTYLLNQYLTARSKVVFRRNWRRAATAAAVSTSATCIVFEGAKQAVLLGLVSVCGGLGAFLRGICISYRMPVAECSENSHKIRGFLL